MQGFADSNRVLPKSTGEVSQWASPFSSLVGSWKRRDAASVVITQMFASVMIVLMTGKRVHLTDV